MQITLNDRVYTVEKVKTRMLRKAIELTEKVNFSNIKASDLDYLIDFIVELYGKQFTRDEFYDGLDAEQLLPTLTNSINSIVGTMGEKIAAFPNA